MKKEITTLFISILASVNMLFAQSFDNYFIENVGQITDSKNKVNESVRFLFSNKNMNVQLRSNGISYDVYKHEGTTVLTHRIDINFKNCSENLEIIPEEKVDFHTNIIRSGRGTFSNISHYGRVTYKNVYNKIDFVFKIDPTTKSYKYDVVLHPGAKINDIALIYNGFSEIELVDGEILIGNSIRKVKEQIPLSFNARTNKPVQVEFKLVKSDSGFATVYFNSKEEFNSEDTYVIDPIPSLVWGKYIGDSLYTETKGVITDRFGNSYICGSTQSLINIATTGAYQDTLADSLINDAYLSKYFKYGGLMWSTYFGGESEDIANDVYVDTNFNVFLCGTTFSQTGITDTLGYQDTLGGAGDAFLAKFSIDGALLWSTYFGGDSLDYAKKISTDYYGNVYMTGDTKSTMNIASPGAAQLTLQGEMDGFAAKFDTIGNLIWSTYIGGAGIDHSNSIAYGDTSVYIVGSTYSNDLVTNPNVHQPNYHSEKDGFISKLNNQGQIEWQSYFGGEKLDELNGVRVLNNNIYFIGTTLSDSNIVDFNLPIIINQMAKSDSLDGFYGKLTNDGVLQWSSYWGGNRNDFGTDLFFELDSNLFIVGTSYSDSLIGIDSTSYQPINNGAGDVILSKVLKEGDLQWTSFYGGYSAEKVEGIAVYGNTSIYVVGSTLSDSLITHSYDTIYPNTFNSLKEGFFSKFIQNHSTLPSGFSSNGAFCDTCPVCDTCQFNPGTPNYRCPWDEVMLTINGGDLGTDAEWVWYKSQCGNSPVIGTGDTIYVYPTQSTTYFVRAESITNATECISTSILVAPYPDYDILTNAYMCSDDSLVLELTGINDSSWTGVWSGVNNYQDSSLHSNVGPSNPALIGWYNVNFVDNYGCLYNDSIDIQYAESPNFTVNSTNVSCFEGDDGSITLSGSDLDSCTVIWSNGSLDTFSIIQLNAGWYDYDVTNQFNCSISDSVEITQPSSFLFDTIIQPTDCLDSTGIIIVSLDSLLMPYAISWNGVNQFNDSILGLPYGSNTIVITASNSCVESFDFHIGNVNNLEVIIDSVAHIYCPSNNQSVILTHGENGNPPYSYSWSPTQSTDSILQGVPAGWYNITITDQSGCYAFDSAEIVTQYTLDLPVQLQPSSCWIPNGIIQIYISDTSVIDNFYWSTGDSSSFILANLWPGAYQFNVIDTLGCLYSDSMEVLSINDLNVYFNPTSIDLYLGDSVQLFPQLFVDTSLVFSWTPTNNLSCNDCINPYASPTITTDYLFSVNNSHGCSDSAVIHIEVTKNCSDVFVPTIFSPNNDQLNDTWQIFGTCIKKMELNLFNQWGEEVFSSNNQNQSWDGTFQGTLVPIGQYSYQLFIENEDSSTEVLTGFVQVSY